MGGDALSKVFTVPNELGLHARAASKLAKLCSSLKPAIRIMHQDNRAADAKSVIGLLTLGAEQGDQLTVSVTGPGAVEAMNQISDLFANNLGD